MKTTGSRPISWPWACLFAALSIGSFHLAYELPGSRLTPLFCITYLAGLVQLARLRTPRQSFYTALGAALLCFGPQLAWMWTIFGLAAIPLWMILSFWTGGFVLLVHAIFVRWGAGWATVAIPIAWTGFEYFRSELYSLKFSWMNIGYAFSGTRAPLHVMGMYGIGFLVAMAAAVWFFPPLNRRRIVSGLLLAAFLMAISPALPAPKEEIQSQGVRIAGIQLEGPFLGELPAALDRLITKHPDADLLVLSEYTLEGPVPPRIKSWCQENGRYLVVGGKSPAGNGDFYNTAFVVGPSGGIVFEQAKKVPIQFFKDGLPAEQQRVWNSPWGKIGICICYDLSYTRVTDQLVKLGAQMLIVPTMDVADWGGRQHRQHARVAPVRASEYGIPIFRLASSGISQAVRKEGSVTSKADFPGEGAMLAASLKPEQHGSLPWDRWAAPICTFAACAMILALAVPEGLLRTRSKGQNRNEPESVGAALHD